jgi:hypothetical protein
VAINRNMRWAPNPPAPRYRIAEIVAIHDGYRADISMTQVGLNKEMTSIVIPQVQVMPHLHLEVGYRVIATVLGTDLCVTDLFGVTHNWVAP